MQHYAFEVAGKRFDQGARGVTYRTAARLAAKIRSGHAAPADMDGSDGDENTATQ